MKLSERMRRVDPGMMPTGAVYAWADEVAALESEVERLREALRPFAALLVPFNADFTGDNGTDDVLVYSYDDVVIVLGDVRRAHEAVTGERRD